MKTQQAIVSDSGMEAQVCNPHDNLFTGGAYNSGHSKEYWDFNKSNPPLPLTQYHTPGEKVEVRPVYAIKNLMGNIEVITKRQYDGYCDANSIQTTPTYNVFKAFEVVSEEESNHIADVGKKVSVEQAAEKLYSFSEVKLIATRFARQSRLMNDVTSNDTIASFNNWFNPEHFKSADILQSGEYVKVSDVEDALLKVGHIRPSVIIRVLETLKNKQ